MGLRFRKSFKIAPGIRVNLGTKSAGISVGTKGCRYSLNTSGRRTASVGIPGTGISYSHTSSGSKNKKGTSRSYSSAAYSQRALIQQQKQQAKLAELEANKLEVKEYENYIELIQNVHRECEPAMNWRKIANSTAPFTKGEIGPEELKAIDAYENFTPTFIEKIFKKTADKRKTNLKSKIATAKKIDDEQYQEWEDSVAFSKKILSGDIDAYYEAIATSNPFEDLVEFGSGFEFGTDSSDTMEIEFMVKSQKVIPEKSKSLTKTGKLSEKILTKTAYYDITQDYVCSCSIRLARELFSLLPVNTVLVHATDCTLNTATGHYEEHTILSIRFTKDRFLTTNFNNIDASDFTESFEHNMNFKKTSGFNPVERITNKEDKND